MRFTLRRVKCRGGECSFNDTLCNQIRLHTSFSRRSHVVLETNSFEKRTQRGRAFEVPRLFVPGGPLLLQSWRTDSFLQIAKLSVQPKDTASVTISSKRSNLSVGSWKVLPTDSNCVTTITAPARPLHICKELHLRPADARPDSHSSIEILTQLPAGQKAAHPLKVVEGSNITTASKRFLSKGS